jgi:hypothetical protein
MKAGVVLAGSLGLWAAGCAGPQPGLSKPGMAYAEIYQRVTNEFACAAFFKPSESGTNSFGFVLAPLILQQTGSPLEHPSLPDLFGALTFSNGAPVFDLSEPTVYWDADTVQLKGKAHTRFSYVWCYSPRPDEPERRQSAPSESLGHAKPGLALQGIRITLNSAGHPAIWEVLADDSGAKVFFVAQHLEAAARTEFGPPLRGRRYAIERSLEAAPHVVVARVLDDSPVVMGPIVYLLAGTREVSTLICRCMSAQAKKLVSTSTYDLQPFLIVAANPLLAQARASLPKPAAFWPGERQPEGRVEDYLRLPRTF